MVLAAIIQLPIDDAHGPVSLPVSRLTGFPTVKSLPTVPALLNVTSIAAVNRIWLDPGNALKGGGALAHSKNVLESHRVKGMVRLGR